MRTKLRLFQIQSPLTRELIKREGPRTIHKTDLYPGVKIGNLVWDSNPLLLGQGWGAPILVIDLFNRLLRRRIPSEAWAIISLIDGATAAPPSQSISSVRRPKSDRSFSRTDHLTREQIWECPQPQPYFLVPVLRCKTLGCIGRFVKNVRNVSSLSVWLICLIAVS